MKTRAERLMEIMTLKKRGLTIRQIAATLDAKEKTVRAILDDPDGSKQRERRKRYQGVCVDCGGPTDGSNGPGSAPTQCTWCFRGIPMRDRQTPGVPSVRRSFPIRLAEIPLEVRLEGVREAARFEPGSIERQELLLAALYPSDNVYWITPAAASILDHPWAEAA